MKRVIVLILASSAAASADEPKPIPSTSGGGSTATVTYGSGKPAPPTTAPGAPPQVATPAGDLTGQKITEIEVVDNTKTGKDTVIYIADVDVGDTFTYETMASAKVNLQSSGLFKDVDVYASRSTLPAGGVRLTLRAVDKLSWIIAPTAYFQPGNVGGGLAYGENNLGGENKKLLLYGQIATEDSLFLGVYLVPSIAGTRFFWRFDTLLRHSIITEYDSPDAFLGQPKPERVSTLNYLNAGLMLGVNLWRDLAFDLRLHGARVFYDDPHYADGYEGSTTLPSPAHAPEVDGWDVSLEGRITADNRASWNGVSAGRVFQMAFERSLTALGSDYDYWTAHVKYEIYKKILDTHNLVWRNYAGIGHHLPFQQEFTSGGVDLRGYEVNQFRGDLKISSRLEYSFQLFWIGPLAFRALGFWDSAYTSFVFNEDNPQRDYLPGQTDNQINRWRNGVGGGLRVYVKAIVLPLLGVDIGYGVEANDYHIYLAVGLTEL